jgi:hypothetical protein
MPLKYGQIWCGKCDTACNFEEGGVFNRKGNLRIIQATCHGETEKITMTLEESMKGRTYIAFDASGIAIGASAPGEIVVNKRDNPLRLSYQEIAEELEIEVKDKAAAGPECDMEKEPLPIDARISLVAWIMLLTGALIGTVLREIIGLFL